MPDKLIIDAVYGADIVSNPETGAQEIAVNLRGHVCLDNSSTDNLNPGAAFTGNWQDTLDYGTVTIGIIADQDSAVDGLVIQWSADGIDVSQDDVFTITANNGKVFTFGAANRYVKVIYTNGGVIQTSFNLQTILRRVAIKNSSHRINDSIVAEDDAELIKAVLTGENPGGTFVNFQSTTAGNFKISLEEFENAISTNSNTQLRTTLYNEAGVTPDIIAYEDDVSIKVIPGSDEVFRVTLDLASVAASTSCMLIDLSDTTNWPHSNTGHIDLFNYSININPSPTPAFVGDFSLGFLSNVDATNGDLHVIQTWHMQKGASNTSVHYDFALNHYALEVAHWFGPTLADDTDFQTDENLSGPDGRTVYPSGDGDLVLKVVMSAGSADISITIGYKVSTS